jgi:hypothetical protein
MFYLWETGEMYTEFWCGKLMGGDNLEGLGVDRRVLLKGILKNYVG